MAQKIYGSRYQVTERIGIGGMAEVYKAIDTTLGRTVAVKVMLPQYAADANFAARFRQEAQAAANLSSPYIVNIYDWGRDQDSYYIVMEYVRGTDLKTAIQQRGRIHPRKVAEIASQVCEALSVAHGYDIIHRDIKSANIMVRPDGNVKVMDFGIAQAGNTGMTKGNSVLGTAHYVSPEQAQGKKLTAASDLYSLGIVMYEAATGRLPFDGPDVVSVAMKQVNELPIQPIEINHDIDPRLNAIIMRALEKKPENRFHTAVEMKNAIDSYLAGKPYAAGVGAVAAGSNAPTQIITPNHVATAEKTTVMPSVDNGRNVRGNTSEFQVPQKNPSRKKFVIIALVAILAIAGALFAFANSSGSLSLGGKKVMVPNVVGMSMEEAQSTLTSDDYKLTVGTITYQQSDTVKEGQVISQDPKANSAVKEGQAVNLVVSAGATTATVPDLSGMTASQAEAALAKAGLTGNSQSGYSDKVELGKVFNQDPAAGSTVPAGSTVTYTISAGEEVSTVAVPSVIGLTKDVAVATLQGVGLQVNVETGSSSDTGGTSVAAGEVYSQSISQGTRVEKGSSITIYVNKEQQKPSTPSSNNSSAGSNNNGSSNNSSEDNGGKTDSGSEDNSNTENSNTGESKE